MGLVRRGCLLCMSCASLVPTAGAGRLFEEAREKDEQGSKRVRDCRSEVIRSGWRALGTEVVGCRVRGNGQRATGNGQRVERACLCESCS